MTSALQENQRQYNLSHKIRLAISGSQPDEAGCYCVLITFDQIYGLKELCPDLRGQFEWWTHRRYEDLQFGEQASAMQLYTFFVEGNYLYVSPRLEVSEKAHQIEPPVMQPQRNALRVEIIPPMARCNLRPQTDTARFVLRERPYHIWDFWGHFGYCVRESCEYCPIAHREPPKV